MPLGPHSEPGIKERRIFVDMKSEIACPECGTKMVEVVEAGVTVDRCPKRHGVWFDLGEVEQHMERSGVDSPGTLSDSDFLISTVGEREPCPCCARNEFRLGKIRGVVFQRCGWCGGIFLSSTQLSALKESTRTQHSRSEQTPADLKRDAWKTLAVVLEILLSF